MASGRWKGSKERRPELATVRWRKLSLWLRRVEPLCRPCRLAGKTVLATQVDHIDEDYPDFFDVANLQPICARCNLEKEIKRKGYRPRVPIGTDGYPKAP